MDQEPRAQQPFLGQPMGLPFFLPPLPPLPAPFLNLPPPGEGGPPKRKIKIHLLREDPQRRSTFKKRRKGIMKKAEELHILCEVDTCVIIYGAGESEPKVWPDTEEAARMCRDFKQLPEMERMRMMRTQAQFLQELVNKKAQQLWHQHDEIADVQLRGYVYEGLFGGDVGGLPRQCLISMHAIIREMLKDRYERCSTLRGDSSDPPPLVAAPPQGNPTNDAAVPSTSTSTDANLEAIARGFLLDDVSGLPPSGENM
ncbi:hypothetical protein Taro_033151 [Colocasia esculenta]|uniref:MADS-box domain-containing protein n=1 Tax=Colocasia esculenta TaxID=4460 RepID=A0A843W0W4_COLES|nr:hypothetical protein [Colocasia esculenta]